MLRIALLLLCLLSCLSLRLLLPLVTLTTALFLSFALFISSAHVSVYPCLWMFVFVTVSVFSVCLPPCLFRCHCDVCSCSPKRLLLFLAAPFSPLSLLSSSLFPPLLLQIAWLSAPCISTHATPFLCTLLTSRRKFCLVMWRRHGSVFPFQFISPFLFLLALVVTACSLARAAYYSARSLPPLLVFSLLFDCALSMPLYPVSACIDCGRCVPRALILLVSASPLFPLFVLHFSF